MRDFAEIGHAADKIVYSRTLEAVSTRRTRLERRFDPDAIRKLKQDSEADMTVAGPELAGTPSAPARWMSATSSSRRWWSGPASAAFPTACGSTSS